MDIYASDPKGSDKDRVELARIAIAENGGQIIGANAQDKERRDDIKRKHEQRAFLERVTELQKRLRDPAYNAAWIAAGNAIDRAQAAIDQAYEDAEIQREALERNAATLEDGRLVFVRDDGLGETQSGEVISAPDMAKAHVPDNATTIEQWREYQKTIKTLGDNSDALDKMRTKRTDPNDPPSLEDLEDMMKKAEALENAPAQTVLSGQVTSDISALMTQNADAPKPL